MKIIMVVLDGARFDKLKDLPNFKSWQKKGTLFSTMITYGSQTIMSLHAIFSGLYGNVSGADNYFGIVNFKKKECKTLPQYLKEIDYYIEGDTISDIVLTSQGFNKLSVHNEKKDNLSLRHKRLIKKIILNKNSFLYLHYSNIHTEMIKIFKRYKMNDFDKKYFSDKGREENSKRYSNYIKKADDYLGILLNACKNLKDTLFIIMSDHGCSLGEKIGELGYGRYCYDYTLKTFALFIYPKVFPVKEIQNLCRTIDILPTILNILNIPEDKNYKKLQGKSLIPLLKKKENRMAYSESAGLIKPYPSDKKPLIRCIRNQDYKLIFDLQNWKKEIYDLKKDPDENINLAETKNIFSSLIEKDLYFNLIKIGGLLVNDKGKYQFK